MARTSSRAYVTRAAKPGAAGRESHRLRNVLLLALSRKERRLVMSRLEFVELPARLILTQADRPMDFCYFLNSGVASIIRVMSNGKGVEIGLIGKEGFIGLPLIVGLKTSPTRAIVQIGGSGYRMPARQLKAVLRECPRLAQLLHRYAHELSIQAIYIAACNRLHEVDRQLARWLVMAHDRIEQPTVPLTQESISHTLGSRRATITEAAGSLQRNGLITYTRGQLTIKNRPGLEAASCECYQGINRQLKKWRRESGRGA